MKIYLVESDIHHDRTTEVNITFKGNQILMSYEIEVNNCFVI